ncbi:hypothetical protein SKAU_G00229710 [Synaphobranchus kaupii]|uniref:Uncharacterized protein n=1 Tax=Synaphobranchus kaupii TaxID=118154 RepID=A0A9Q1F5L2_SYNKA|nr:hypothetical protein SKAU_G00229710 [Synaphobranchus kaupii]
MSGLHGNINCKTDEGPGDQRTSPMQAIKETSGVAEQSSQWLWLKRKDPNWSPKGCSSWSEGGGADSSSRSFSHPPVLWRASWACSVVNFLKYPLIGVCG